MRNLVKMQNVNDGTRTLVESIMAPEIIQALSTLRNQNLNAVIIGGIALSYYVKPRQTQDIDLLMLSDAEIVDHLDGFKKTRAHAFQHNDTHVEVEIVTPEYVNLPDQLANQVFATAVEEDGFKIASPSGLVALKLMRLTHQDGSDIIALLKHREIDLNGFSLPIDKIEKFMALIEIADKEKFIS